MHLTFICALVAGIHASEAFAFVPTAGVLGVSTARQGRYLSTRYVFWVSREKSFGNHHDAPLHTLAVNRLRTAPRTQTSPCISSGRRSLTTVSGFLAVVDASVFPASHLLSVAYVSMYVCIYANAPGLRRQRRTRAWRLLPRETEGRPAWSWCSRFGEQH